jgi:uroporphyrinogen-III synthase
MLPAPGQGALAVQCRADDEAVLALLAVLEDAQVRAAVTAERTFLTRLGGGCSAPVAAYAQPSGQEQHLQMQALVASPDGCLAVRVQGEGNGVELGEQLARQALAQGADLILGLAVPPVADQPLRGKRIVITRAREQADDLADKLAALGATPLVMPAIRIAPLPDLRRLDQAVQKLASYDWLIFTSVNGVQIFAASLKAAGHTQEIFRKLRVAAVGPATARAVRQLGADVTFAPPEFVAEAVAAGLGNVQGQRVLLPQAAIARPTLADLLGQQGAHVDAIPIYQTLPVLLTPENLAELERGVDVVIFTSGTTVRNFMHAVQAHPAVEHQVRRSLITCIGPVTAEEAQALDLDVRLIAAQYTADGLVQALRTHFQKEPA